MNDIPRRNRLDLNTPAERAIYDAMQAVEAMPADVRLTDAVVLLEAARDSVADYVDGILQRRHVTIEQGTGVTNPADVSHEVRCKAKSAADPPQDCDWPHCGCDPHAEKVIAALQEEGWLSPKEVAPDYFPNEGDRVAWLERCRSPAGRGPEGETMKCAIVECGLRADPDGGALCPKHQKWTASRMQRCLLAIQDAVANEDGCDGFVGEALLRELGFWPSRLTQPGAASPEGTE